MAGDIITIIPESRWEWAWNHRAWFVTIPKDIAGGAVVGAFSAFGTAFQNATPGQPIAWRGPVIIGIVSAVAGAILLPYCEAGLRWLQAPRLRTEETADRLGADLAEAVSKNEVLSRTLSAVTQQNAELQNLLDRRHRNQALADELTAKHAYGVAEILNRPPLNDDDLLRWRAAEHGWTQEVIAIMNRYGCTAQDLNHVRTIGIFNVLPLHGDSQARRDLSMFVERLNRVAAISTKYAED